MQTIKIPSSCYSLSMAVAYLVANAPARADYWGVTIRARFATTRPADVEAQYKRALVAAGIAYGARLPASQRARMTCGKCGAKNCKMWREYNTCADYTDILCGPCALAKDGRRTGAPIDDAGKVYDESVGRSDQIGWLVPAVPTTDGTFWGYTSVPSDGVQWWQSLPSYPASVPS